MDNSFGINGVVTNTGTGGGQSVCLQPDGKIIIAGGKGAAVFSVVRLNSDGSLDTSFDTDGIVTTNMGGYDFVTAWDSVLQTDGKIVVTGTSHNGSDYDMAVVRYNSDGSLDSTFDMDGKAIFDFGGGEDGGAAVMMQLGGRILVDGHHDGGTATILRLNGNGSLDTTFSDDGIITTSDAQRWIGLTVQADNKIVATGYGGAGDDFVTARFESFLPTLDKFVFLPSVRKP